MDHEFAQPPHRRSTEIIPECDLPYANPPERHPTLPCGEEKREKEGKEEKMGIVLGKTKCDGGGFEPAPRDLPLGFDAITAEPMDGLTALPNNEIADGFLLEAGPDLNRVFEFDAAGEAEFNRAARKVRATSPLEENNTFESQKLDMQSYVCVKDQNAFLHAKDRNCWKEGGRTDPGAEIKMYVRNENDVHETNGPDRRERSRCLSHVPGFG